MDVAKLDILPPLLINLVVILIIGSYIVQVIITIVFKQYSRNKKKKKKYLYFLLVYLYSTWTCLRVESFVICMSRPPSIPYVVKQATIRNVSV